MWQTVLCLSLCICCFANIFIGETLIRVEHNGNVKELASFLEDGGAVIDLVNHKFVDCYIDGDSIISQLNQRNISYSILPNVKEQIKEYKAMKPSVFAKDEECCSDSSWAHYHDYDALTELLEEFASNYPEICQLTSVGQSVLGRELWMVKISDNVDVLEAGEPQFQYIGNMHGDEVVGRELLLRYIYHLLSNYVAGDPDIVEIVDTTQIYILPSMNPDGYELDQRANANNVDLNRDFPDRQDGMSHYPQPETSAVMACSLSNHFVLSANLHGGSVVVNYPYDDNTAHLHGVYSACPDDALFRDISVAYSRTNGPMYSSTEFAEGITNGAAWYTLQGGMQDWNYAKTYSNFHVTIELSYVKWPTPSTLAQFWEDNRESLSSYLSKVHQGVRGSVADSEGNSVSAVISVDGINHDVLTSALDGWYYRPLTVGSYTIACTSPSYPGIILRQQITVLENTPVIHHFVFE